MIIVTGAAGFIGSCMVSFLNRKGYNSIVAVDTFDSPEKQKNLTHLNVWQRVERTELFPWLDEHHREIEFVFHFGARTDTAEFSIELLDRLNTSYSKLVWEKCTQYQIPLIYASSAATYGMGQYGFNDNENLIKKLEPLNPYGKSKNDFDIWVLTQPAKPFFWAGLKFFNVYGPNEYHKGRMASVIFHAYRQIQATSKMKLFRSHHKDYKNGEQLRDFIYVKDLLKVCYFFMQTRKSSGIYNLGSGKARTFLDLTKATFAAMGIEENIEYIDIPEDIRDKYQYFTEANMLKMRNAGYEEPFTDLESGIQDYVKNYLFNEKYF
ncbi:MAG: ADP-glyceromanno-heptose 6-epimerase [Cyclobacteriaceae bacterium]|nr:ADP-glyceromanno-heptose 6-epimerase [Cyclobacteriaceae bacterium]